MAFSRERTIEVETRSILPGSESGPDTILVDFKIDKVKRHATETVAILTIDERTRNRRKINQAAADANDAIERVIEKAARSAKEISRLRN